MARQPDIRYVQMYTYGSAAKKLETPLSKKKKQAVLPKPKTHKEQHRVLHLDPLSWCALGAAGLMLICLVVGMIHLGQTQRQQQALDHYVSRLQDENTRLEKEFHEYYDPQQVQQQADAQGMIPDTEAQRIQLELKVPEKVEEPGVWERIKAFFTELFA
jgi:cell division protein FtsL